MDDTRTQEQATFPAAEEAANNNIEGLEGAPIESHAEQPSFETRVTELQAELAEQKDRLLRALAETENVRRRAQREREDASKYAVAGFAKDLLSAADNLRRALESLPESEVRDERTRSLLAGVEATERELLSVFERHGIKRIDPKGERFDHNLHQAIFEAERPDEPSGTIVEVLQPGYLLHERLLRPAMVGVAKGGPKATEPANPAGK
ncbi:MAG TPA: nucleotide exchange factor GrpE [Stellaceae bacterium]|jgi:molecular chaperone GrpE|nr:nucleotide exchange factor GrpE [Stellaceae bacterium]